ncbi:amidohydrolase family protein [Sphingomonas alpina]|uniref:Amidohydrolase family protein n=1 Tax=Sphingomonas alpina TaxID=653931 RepID=A0A7H0LIL5_9SPHN|nr:amidohydrolase family protein [Sphingomonas alpina]QNQ09518.1 amidohydrolase family protein [Sphingomonas alpina]
MRRIDAHHHLWEVDSGHHPMLFAAPVARFWGNSAELRGHYDVEAFMADARAAGVIASVHVEAGFTPPDGEARAMQTVADAHGFPQAFLTRIDLAAADAGARISADAAFANWRGIRITTEWPGDPALERPARTSFADAGWRHGYIALDAAGGVADIMLWPEQLAEAAALAQDFPGTPIVIEHFALADGNPAWADGMARLAACRNVAVKLSGPGLVRRDWSADTIRPMILRLLDLFGSDRLMIGSNAPVDLVMADYPTIVARFDSAIQDLPDTDRQALWHDTAARIYRIAGES